MTTLKIRALGSILYLGPHNLGRGFRNDKTLLAFK